MICVSLRAIALKRFTATARGNTVFGSMSNGASVSSGTGTVRPRLKLWIITEVGGYTMSKEKVEYLDPVHPGEVLWLDFMEPLGLSQNKLAHEIGVSPRRINEIIHGKRGITADTAMRLSRFFGTSAKMWLGLQAEYELDCLKRDEREGKTLYSMIKSFKPAAAMI